MVIDPPRPGKVPPNHQNHIPGLDHRRTTTTTRPTVTPKIILATTSTTTTKAPRPRVTPPQHKPWAPTRKPFIPTRKPPVPTRKPYIPRPATPTRPPLPLPAVPTVDNSIQKEVTKQRGDVHSKKLFTLCWLIYVFIYTWLKAITTASFSFRFWVIDKDIVYFLTNYSWNTLVLPAVNIWKLWAQTSTFSIYTRGVQTATSVLTLSIFFLVIELIKMALFCFSTLNT